MWIVSSAVIKLAFIALLGFYLSRKKYIDNKVLAFLTFFVINFTTPFLIFSYLVENSQVVLKHPLKKFIGLSIIIFLTGLLLGLVFSLKKKSELKPEFLSLTSFQNCGYLPMTMALFLFPKTLREEFFVYIFLYILGFNIILWSVGSFFIFKKKGEQFKFKTILTPPIISTLVGIAFIYADITAFIPSFILAPMKMVGEMSFVLGILILGCWLSKTKLSGIRSQIPILAKLSLIKLVVVPLIFFLAVTNLKIFSLWGFFIVLESAMPSAASLPIVVNLRGANSEFVSQAVFTTHILSILTVPIWIGLFLGISGFSF